MSYKPRQRKFHAKCLFPRLTQWMIDNGKTIDDISDALFCEISTAYNRIDGTRKLPKEDIDRLLYLTGLTYEELFKEDANA